MQAKFNPLQVIINPPGIQFGMPGDTIELYVVVINQGDQSAVIDLYFVFDEVFQNLTGWSSSPRESLALAPQQNSDEVKFEFQITANALPGTYDYTLVVDSPLHYPQDTPITFPNQIKVLLKEQTAIRVNDPTFSIRPNTNPNKPLIFNSGEPLQVEVIVDNRSYLVDRFRLSCPDLDDDWFTISYPVTGFEGTGLISDVTALELNPGTQGQILLKFHPPGDTLAGSYSPTIRLYSENSPDLVLLDLVYIQIPTNYRLDIELHTILGQVSRSLGKYELSLANRGNIVRELILTLKSRDEEELYTYKFEPSEVRLLPNRSAVVNLAVKPRPWWRRPWFGAGLVVNFQLDIKDAQNLPLPNTLPQGTLVWKPRPLWQFILLILAVLGLLGGIGFIIWRILNPEPLRLENFSANNPRITEEEDEVALKWDIHNYQQLQKLVLTAKGSQPIQPITYDFSNGIPKTLGKGSANQIPPCQVQEKQELICSNVKTGVKTKGNYTFELQAFYRSGIQLFSPNNQVVTQTTQVEVAEKQIAEVLNFQTDKTQYTKGQNILLSWTIARPLLLAQIQISGSADDGTLYREPITYKFNQGNLADPKLQKLCTQQNQQLQCTNIPLAATKAGNFAFEIKALSNNGSQKPSFKKTESKIVILPKPFKIVSFTINGSEQQNLELNEGTTATLSWRVEGENIQVKLLPYGDVKPVDSKPLPVNLAFPPQITLQVSDISGKQQPQQRGFAITVIKKVEPTPTPSINPLAPNLPSNSSPFKTPLPLR